MFKTIATMMVTLMAFAVVAQNPAIRIDLNAVSDKIELKPGTKPEGVTLTKASWLKDDAKYYLICSGGKVTKDWTEYEFTFTPDKSGKVSLSLLGPWYKPQDAQQIVPIWMGYDNVTVTGATLANPDFEDLNEKGEFNGWSGNITNIIKEVPDAKSGKNYIRVWHNLPMRQTMTVTQDQMVTVKFSIKAVDSPTGM